MASFLSLLKAIPVFFEVLPYFCQIALKIISLLEKISELAKKNELEMWLESIEQAIDKLDQAKTVDEKRSAASDLGKLLRSFK